MCDGINAHKHSRRHRTEINASLKCGCFCCINIFDPIQITDWIDGNDTALCPVCGVDAVIGDASGFEIGPDLLKEMQEQWF